MNSIQPYIQSYKQFQTASPDEALTAIIGRVESSHEGLFVFDNEKRFHGVIWLYHVLYKRRPMRTSQVKQYTVMTPKLVKTSSVYDAVRAMIEFRLYTMPVFDSDEKVIGAVTATNIMRRILDDDENFRLIRTAIKPSKPFIVRKDEKLGRIYGRMRRSGSSRMVAVDETDQLIGLVSRRDIYTAFILPTMKPRYRSRSSGERQLLFDRDWPKIFDYKIRQLSTLDVVTADEKEDMRLIFRKMLNRGVHSVVLTDKDNRPQAILSTRSFLKAIAGQELLETMPITIVDEGNALSAFRRIEVEDILKSFSSKLKNRNSVTSLTLTVDTVKNSQNKVSEYEVSLHAGTGNGHPLIAEDTQYELRPGVMSVVAKIKRQLTRAD